MKSRFKIHKPINVDTLVKRIGEHFGFTLADLKGKRRTDAHISCRFAVYHVLRKMLKMPYAQIGKILNRDHGAVMNGVQQFNDWATIDNACKRSLIACEAIGNSWITECDYHVASEPAVNQQSVNNGKKGVNTKGSKTLKVNAKTAATIDPLFTGDEKSTYIYKYNSKSSISFKLEKQLNNKDVFGAVIEYIKYRKQINKRLSQAGLDMQLKKLSKHFLYVSFARFFLDGILPEWDGIRLVNKECPLLVLIFWEFKNLILFVPIVGRVVRKPFDECLSSTGFWHCIH